MPAEEKKDPFEEIDFGSFFQDYLDPGYRSPREMEDIERPSFENFLSKPGNLTDHLMWQLGSLSTSPEVRQAAEVIIGNLNEDGYLIASDEELLGVAPPSSPEADAAAEKSVVKEAAALGLDSVGDETDAPADGDSVAGIALEEPSSGEWDSSATLSGVELADVSSDISDTEPAVATAAAVAEPVASPSTKPPAQPRFEVSFSQSDLHEALEIIRQLDPQGVACRDLRECLLCQLRYHQIQLAEHRNGNGEGTAQVIADTIAIVDQHLRALQGKQYKEIAKAIGRPIEAVQQALEYIRTLDPRPGLRYNATAAPVDRARRCLREAWRRVAGDDERR